MQIKNLKKKNQKKKKGKREGVAVGGSHPLRGGGWPASHPELRHPLDASGVATSHLWG
jgi:hypothetical protein